MPRSEPDRPRASYGRIRLHLIHIWSSCRKVAALGSCTKAASLDRPRLRQDFEHRHRRWSAETGRVGGRIQAGLSLLLAPARPRIAYFPATRDTSQTFPQ
jgi:hypothetical protein